MIIHPSIPFVELPRVSQTPDSQPVVDVSISYSTLISIRGVHSSRCLCLGLPCLAMPLPCTRSLHRLIRITTNSLLNCSRVNLIFSPSLSVCVFFFFHLLLWLFIFTWLQCLHCIHMYMLRRRRWPQWFQYVQLVVKAVRFHFLVVGAPVITRTMLHVLSLAQRLRSKRMRAYTNPLTLVLHPLLAHERTHCLHTWRLVTYSRPDSIIFVVSNGLLHARQLANSPYLIYDLYIIGRRTRVCISLMPYKCHCHCRMDFIIFFFCSVVLILAPFATSYIVYIVSLSAGADLCAVL